MTSHLLLVGLTALEVTERDRVDAAARLIDADVAFLQIGDPSLSASLTRLADAGALEVTLVGVSLGSRAPAQSWLRRVAGHWWRERGQHAPVIQVATGVLRNDLGAHDADALRSVAIVARPITGTEAALESAAWEDVPSHRHQVFICRGPRCTAAGSDQTMAALDQALAERGLGDDDVLVTVTGCQFPCNHAPVVSVQPDDVWYGRVNAAAIELITIHHLVGGEPVESKALRRSRGRTSHTDAPPFESVP